jgi:hypothetical protein
MRFPNVAPGLLAACICIRLPFHHLLLRKVSSLSYGLTPALVWKAGPRLYTACVVSDTAAAAPRAFLPPPRPDCAQLFFAVPPRFLAGIFSSLLHHTSFSRIRFSGHILCSFSQVSPAPPPFFHQHRSNIMSASFGVTTSPAHCNV